MRAVMLRTERLTLRPLAAQDAAPLARIAGDRSIADTMISVPHPFYPEHARMWVEDRAHRYFAVCPPDELVGLAALRDIDPEHLQAELSFFVARAHWGRGIAREAGEALVRNAFEELRLNRLVAFRMMRNEASGLVLERLGFRPEGLLRQRVRKWGVFEDVVAYALLSEDHLGARGG
jgi:ribosomal-protein-alanine N-acetyltransferase